MGGNTSVLASTQWWFHAKSRWTHPGFVEAAKKFDKADLAVDLSGKVYLITGANSGLGFSMAKTLAKKKATIVMLCRSKERGEKARQEIMEETGSESVELQLLDVSRPRQIRDFADSYLKTGRRIDALINNAGALFDERKETEEGYEQTFAVHTLGPYLLTEYLMPALEATNPPGRVVTMTSGGLYTVRMDAKHFQTDMEKFEGEGLRGDGAAVYAQCKRHQLYLTEIWAKRHKDTGVHFHVTHPGWARTEGTKGSLPKWFDGLELRSPEEGADTAIWLAAAQNGHPMTSSGKFWFDRDLAPGDFGGIFANTASSDADIQKLEAYMIRCKMDCEKQLEQEGSSDEKK